MDRHPAPPDHESPPPSRGLCAFAALLCVAMAILFAVVAASWFRFSTGTFLAVASAVMWLAGAAAIWSARPNE